MVFVTLWWCHDDAIPKVVRHRVNCFLMQLSQELFVARKTGCKPCSHSNSTNALRIGELNSRRARTNTITVVEIMNIQGDTIQAITAIPK